MKNRLRCNAYKTSQLLFVRRSRNLPRLNLLWNEVTGLFSRYRALMPGYEWTTLSLLCVLILMELFSVVLFVYIITGLPCRRQLLDCVQVLYTLAFPSPWLVPAGVLADLLIFFHQHGVQFELSELKPQIIRYICRS